MADAPDTKLPIAVKLNPKARLLSGNDRSLIVYGSKTGLTILYPTRSRPFRPATPRSPDFIKVEFNESNDGSDLEVLSMSTSSEDWVIYENPEDAILIQRCTTPSTDSEDEQYESYSEPEEYNIQRNTRFPWKYSINLGSPVTNFAFPGASIPMFGQTGRESHKPWLDKVYIAAITEDGTTRIITLPLRLPPPGASFPSLNSSEFPVDITVLTHSQEASQTLPRGICVDFMRQVPKKVSP
ncbi:hypothetical protein ABW20_dc0109464 [Dactylellina cionopaga]|nr:hypothetical protein ABW20_dc0109464 [Dactylellina cionopaga]